MSDEGIEWLFIEPWGKLGVRLFQGQPFVHCNIERWSPSLSRQCKVVWGEFKTIMAKRGYKKLFSMVPANNEKLHKWQKSFGQMEVITISTNVLYMQEI